LLDLLEIIGFPADTMHGANPNVPTCEQSFRLPRAWLAISTGRFELFVVLVLTQYITIGQQPGNPRASQLRCGNAMLDPRMYIDPRTSQPFVRVRFEGPRRREGLGLTQETIAFEAGLSVRHYQLIESGASNPRLNTHLNLASALQLKLHDLLRKVNL